MKASGTIWHDYMERVHEGLEKEDFDMYIKTGAEKNEMETTTEAEGEGSLESNKETETYDTSIGVSTEDASTEEVIQDTPYIPETSEGDGIYVDPY